MRTIIGVLLALLASQPTASFTFGQTNPATRSAQVLFADRSYQDVIDLLEEAPALPSDDAYLLGRAYQELYRYEEAARAFSRADTSSWRVLAGWGQSLRRLGRTAEARTRFEKAYRQDSLRREVAVPLAELYAEAGQWPDVRDVLTSLVRGAPENPFFLSRLGKSYRAMDSLHAAARSYDRAYRRNRQSRTLPLDLTTVLLQSDSLDRARQVMDTALARHPNQARFWKRLGQIELKAKKHNEAIQAFQRALLLGDQSVSTLRPLGMSLYYSGRDSASVNFLRGAFQADTTHARTALFGQPALANTYEQLGQAQKAAADYPAAIRADRMALRLAPGDRDVLFHLAMLYDDYYRDPRPALTHYRLLLSQLNQITFDEVSRMQRSRLEKMREYAAWRVRELKRRDFFQRSSSQSARPDSAS